MGDALSADKGIQTGPDSKYFALYSELKKPFTNDGKELVLQFQVKHEQDLDCGGGYIKLLPGSRCATLASLPVLNRAAGAPLLSSKHFCQHWQYCSRIGTCALTCCRKVSSKHCCQHWQFCSRTGICALTCCG